MAPATYLGVSFDIGPARIFLPLCVCVCVCVYVCVCGGGGGHIFCQLQMASLLLCPPPPPPPQFAWRVLLCSCLHWKTLFHLVIFTCTLCVALVDSLVSRVGSSLTSSTFVPGSWVVLSSCYVRNCLFVGFAIWVSSSDSAPLFGLVSVEQ